jgi:D-alanyl-D-alanine carboxypeptidase/D-alanyl-D-alanine-endopeptidase (penicillin-binding protein 4)
VLPRITVRNKTRSVAQGGSKGIGVSRDHHANTVTVSGSYSATTSWFPLAIHDQPDLLAADHLAAALRSRGIILEGQVRTGRVDPAAGVSLVRHQDPLLPALAILNQRSQNFYGEQLIRVLGAHVSGSGSIAAGTAAVEEILGRHLGLDMQQLTLLDGSGLSYDNQASAAVVCRLLAALHRHPQGGTYRETLKDQWHGHTLAKVKTGSLAVARCLAGYIRGPDGRYYAFAILLNRGDASSIGWANHLRDKSFQAMCAALGKPGTP